MVQPINQEQIDSFERDIELSAEKSFTSEHINNLTSTALPTYNEGIESTKTKRREDLDVMSGRYWQRSVTMSDGHRHTELIGLSNDAKADELVASIPAWWTRLDAGLNKITSDSFLAQGQHTLTKGVTENHFAPLSRGAHDFHTSLSDNKSGFEYYFDTNNILLHGDSNGAMQGTGIISYANRHNRVVESAYLVDPCMVHKLQLQDVKKYISHPSYFPKEVISVTRQVTRMLHNQDTNKTELAKTIETNPHRVLGNIMLAQALFSGEFGLLLAHLPTEQRVHYLLFNHSIANQKSSLLEILKSTDANATTEVRTGTHTSLANPQVLKEKIGYLLTKSELNTNFS